MIAGVLAAVVSVVIPMLPNGYVDYVSNTIELGPVCLTMASNVVEQKVFFYLSILCIAMFIVPAIFFTLLLKRLLEPISQGHPFTKRASHTLNIMALLTLITGALHAIGAAVIEQFIFQSFELSRLLQNEKIAAVSLNSQVRLEFLAFAAVLLLLSYIFRYGEELQQLSDETL